MSNTLSKVLTPAERSAIIPSIATARFAGQSIKDISTSIGIGGTQLRGIINSQEYEDFLKDLQNQSLKHAMSSFRSELDRLSPLAVKALRTNLEEGKIEAVKLYSQLIGALKPEERAEQQQAIQIVLPEGMMPKTEHDV